LDDLEYEVEDEDERAWRQSLPSGLWDFIVTLKVGLEKASHSALRVHRESYIQWITTGKDLHSLDVWVEDSTDSLGAHQTLTGIMASNVWDGLAQLSSKVAGTAVIVDAAATETLKIRTKVDGLRAKASFLADKLSLFAEELSKHSETIDVTQEIARTALGLVAELKESPGAGLQTLQEDTPDNNKEERRQRDLTQASVGRDIALLNSELADLKRVHKTGDGNIAPSLIKGINSQEDVLAWVYAKFGGLGEDPNPSDSFVDVATTWGRTPVMFDGFCDLYVLFATFEDDQARITKGESLKELDNLNKSGYKHPSKAVIVYSFKRPVPATFGQGHVIGGTFLPALKTVQDWDSSFSTESMPKPGLKQLLLEQCEGIEQHIRCIIEEIYERHGLTDIASLAKGMLSASVKLLKILIEYYLSTLYRDLTDRSGFLVPEEAWGLLSQCGRSVFLPAARQITCGDRCHTPEGLCPSQHGQGTICHAQDSS
jgi:hypothetical protein